jgi:nicotinamide-nucleotide amidase
MTARAGILITGTEVLTGRVADRNGPWLSDRLREIGVDLAQIVIVGDRPADMHDGLGWLAGAGVDLIITSGGLGPTEDDRTAQIVGEFQGREMVLDEALEERIAEIVRSIMIRWPNLDPDAVRAANRKQAVVPQGATILDPVGTAPGLVVPPADGREGPTIVVLPGPPRELQPLWATAAATDAFAAAVTGATTYDQTMLRIFGLPESEIVGTMREARERGIDIDRLEITTCLRRGELEIVTRYEPSEADVYAAFEAIVREKHGPLLFSDDGSTIDQQVAGLLRGLGWTIAVAESCTGGLLAGRLTELPGSSDYMIGGVTAYSNAVKVALAGVDPELIERHGAVSQEVAVALAQGACSQLGADIGIGVTGIAGPDGGTDEKPVGTVCFAVATTDGRTLHRTTRLPGGRFDVRDRSTTVAMHLVARVLREAAGLAGPADRS